MIIISFVVGALVGFVVGLLVYRNNTKRFETALQISQEEVNRLRNLIPKK